MSDNRRAKKPERPINHSGLKCVARERDTGLASNATLKIRKGGVVSVKTRRMTGGTFFEVCALCLSRGKTTIVCNV